MKKKSATRRVIILGAGQIGTHIMQSLSTEGYNVVLVDAEENAIQEASRLADISTFVGNATDPRIFFDLNLTNTDMLLAVTDSDETNLLACNMANSYGVGKKIARVRKPYYKYYAGTPIGESFWKNQGVDILFNQSEIAAREIERLLENPGAMDTISIADGNLQVLAYRVKAGSLLIGRRLVGLRDVQRFENLIVAAITTTTPEKNKDSAATRKNDHGKEHTIIPRGDYKIRENDLMFISGQKHAFDGLAPLFDPGLPPVFRKVFILGGNILSHYLADHLQKRFPKLTIYLIENTRKSAYTAKEKLHSKVKVLNVDVHDLAALMEEGLDSTSVYIGAATNEDDNMIGCLMAKEEANARTIAIVQNPTFVHLIPYLELDAAVSPKLLLVDDVLKALHNETYNILSARVHDAELLELNVNPGSILDGQILSEFRFPDNAIIVSIFRDGEVIIPKGATQLQANDHVAVFAHKSAIDSVRFYFEK